LVPNFAKAHNNLGGTLASQAKFEDAMTHFEKAISIDPDYIDARKNLELARSIISEK
jgi:Tfp pilus assembly protein PilF